MHDLHGRSLDPLTSVIGYSFTDPALLRLALIHTSYANEHPDRALASNERLEFLGDAVLGSLVAHRLYECLPESAEGEMTVLRARLVRQSSLAHWARGWHLGAFLLLGRGEQRGGGRERAAILARAFESILGAIYLDGGYDAVRSVVYPLVDTALASGVEPGTALDAKSRLQHYAQANGGVLPTYELVALIGPGHAPEFEIQVSLGPEHVASGRGTSKQTAQQFAAHALLQQLGVEPSYELPTISSEPTA